MPRHDLRDVAAPPQPAGPWSWRPRDRTKTVGVALCVCLNIGTDPPDVAKRSPCARHECWLDPFAMTRSKALEAIGTELQQQYTYLQNRSRYRQALDPTVDQVRKVCAHLRRAARHDRLLFHYNGHGVPRPTANGELWVFNKNYTQYIPLSLYDLRAFLGSPAVYVLDCSGAGVLLPHFTTPLQPPVPPQGGDGTDPDGGAAPNSSRQTPEAASPGDECIVLMPCAAGELLPMDPRLPADLFTSCLTTPIAIALRWFILQNPMSMGGVPLDIADSVPGKLGDRKTPLGELNWVFTAVTDTIGCVLCPASPLSPVSPSHTRRPLPGGMSSPRPCSSGCSGKTCSWRRCSETSSWPSG
jgi:regulator-associated protein of mTOR